MTMNGAYSDETNALADLAGHAGIAVDWTDARGRPQRVADEVLRTLLQALGLRAGDIRQIRESAARLYEESVEPEPFIIVDAGAHIEVDSTQDMLFKLRGEDGEEQTLTAHGDSGSRVRLPAIDTPGYYRLRAGERQWTVAVAPAHSPSMAEIMEIAQPRAWGVAAQLYSLRRDHGGHPARAAGMGDFTALAQLATAAAGRGADAVAISPVHAMFAADPGRYSPYGPSSRLFLNSLYVDPAAVLGEPAVAAAMQALNLGDQALRLDALPLIEWPAVAKLRLKLLRRMYDDFRNGAGAGDRHAAFDAFRLAGGEPLESHARFEALHARHLPPLGDATDWRHWPADLRDHAGAGVRAYAHAHDKDIAFHIFLQWLAAQGLADAQRRARAAGMAVGLIGDLAVGTDPGGSHAWSRQGDILEGLSPGAPPDIYNPLGQCWGLTAFSPRALRLKGYSAFIEMLRAALAQTGGVRIDHVLGLARMWLVPEGALAKDGAYLRYPLEDMLRLIALEAWRHRAVVIGENLGTVPEGFNHRIERAGMLGMNVLWFQRDGGAGDPAPFQAPQAWPAAAISTTSTHDLPTIAGWWNGNDIEWRARLQLLAADETEEALRAQREKDRDALWRALRDAGCLEHEAPEAPPADAPIAAILRFVATTPSPLMIVPVEDLLGLPEQPNLPGTVDTHPNWRRRLDVNAAHMFDDDTVRGRIDAVTHERRAP
jgi:4-alpha-glucanotransferase